MKLIVSIREGKKSLSLFASGVERLRARESRELFFWKRILDKKKFQTRVDRNGDRFFGFLVFLLDTRT